MPILEISCIPVGTESPSFSTYVEQCCQTILKRGLRYHITPTSTVVEGDLEDLWEVARECHGAQFEKGVKRVITHITLDHRTDKPQSIGEMIKEVAEKVHQENVWDEDATQMIGGTARPYEEQNRESR